MSRVHDALRRAEKGMAGQPPPEPRAKTRLPMLGDAPQTGSAVALAEQHSLNGLLDLVQEIPYSPSREALLIEAVTHIALP